MNSWELARTVAAKTLPHMDRYTVDDELPHRLRGPGGAILTFTGLNTWQPRVAITGSLPIEYVKRRHTTHQHGITVVAGRTGQVIAADITRRLIPPYLTTLEQAIQTVTADRAAETERRDHAERIAAQFRETSISNHSDETHIRIYLRDNPNAVTTHIRLSNAPSPSAHINIRFASTRIVDAITNILSKGDPCR